jgi:hypothetical protein
VFRETDAGGFLVNTGLRVCGLVCALLLSSSSIAAPQMSTGATRAMALFDRTINGKDFQAARDKRDFAGMARAFRRNGLDPAGGNPQEQAFCNPPWYLTWGLLNGHPTWMCVKGGIIGPGTAVPTGHPPWWY